MKHIYLYGFLLLLIVVAGCDNNPTGPATPNTGSIFMTSSPSGAEIWVNNVDKGKVTPDSITGLNEGNYNVTLKLSGYKDTTISVSVTAGFPTHKDVTLSSSLSVISFGTVRIYETTGTTAAQPSGLDLSAGLAYGISSANKGLVDIYYSSNGFVVRSADDINNRVTDFFVGNSNNLNDGTDSPAFTASGQGGWTDRVADDETNYVFLFDQDLHYSKLKFTRGGGTGTGDPSYVDVQWLYNTQVNDPRF